VLITDDGISDRAAAMVESADIKLIVVPVGAAKEEAVS
jgi:DeoR family ulaG and ulaABCDEF operon transcriptional repressor